VIRSHVSYEPAHGAQLGWQAPRLKPEGHHYSEAVWGLHPLKSKCKGFRRHPCSHAHRRPSDAIPQGIGSRSGEHR
jgi:hypothetical protein